MILNKIKRCYKWSGKMKLWVNWLFWIKDQINGLCLEMKILTVWKMLLTQFRTLNLLGSLFCKSLNPWETFRGRYSKFVLTRTKSVTYRLTFANVEPKRPLLIWVSRLKTLKRSFNSCKTFRRWMRGLAKIQTTRKEMSKLGQFTIKSPVTSRIRVSIICKDSLI